MADAILAGDGAPPPPPPVGPAPAIPTEGNASVLEYARRKARQREATGTKSAAAPPKATAQKQPGTPAAEPVQPVLSHAAEVKSDESDSSDASDRSDTATPAPEPTPEEPSSSEPEIAGEDDQALPGDAPEWVQKRIARFTRQKGELERKLQAIEAEKQQLVGEVERFRMAPPPEAPLPVVVNESDPASGITNENQLEQAATQARLVKRWCERNPEGGTLQVPDGKGGYITREFSGEQVRAMKESAEDDLDQHLPKRREYLRAEQVATGNALREFPWLADKSSPQFTKFQQGLREYPQIRLRPDWAHAMAVFVEGSEAVEARLKASAQPPALPKARPTGPPPRVLGASPSAPARTGPRGAIDAQLAAAEKEWKETPNQRTFARLQQVKRQQRES